MMKKFVNFFFYWLLVASFPLTACATGAHEVTDSNNESQYRVAAIFPGVITDADYNTLGFIGLGELQRDFGLDTAYSESVTVSDFTRVAQEYTSSGFNIIWAHGSQFLTQIIDFARQNPDVIFIGEGDNFQEVLPANLWLIDRNFQIGYYALGALAVRITKTGTIGYVGGLELPYSYAEVHAIEQAIQDTRPAVALKVLWAGDFNDPTSAKDVAETLIANDVDVIMGSLNLGMLGIFEAAKASPRPVMVTAKYTDKTAYATENYVTSLLYDFSGPLKEIYSRIQKGEKGAYYPLGFATGVSLQTPLHNVSTEVATEMAEVIRLLRDGKTQVIKDTSPLVY